MSGLGTATRRCCDERLGPRGLSRPHGLSSLYEPRGVVTGVSGRNAAADEADRQAEAAAAGSPGRVLRTALRQVLCQLVKGLQRARQVTGHEGFADCRKVGADAPAHVLRALPVIVMMATMAAVCPLSALRRLGVPEILSKRGKGALCARQVAGLKGGADCLKIFVDRAVRLRLYTPGLPRTLQILGQRRVCLLCRREVARGEVCLEGREVLTYLLELASVNIRA
jgi:hypothetical protein